MQAAHTPKNHPLIRYSDHDFWTAGDAFEGVQIFGATGSGKTSGSGKAIALAMLRAGFGGLVLCAKGDELENWLEYAAATGREKELVIYGLKGADADRHRRGRVAENKVASRTLDGVPVVDNFNFLEYCRSRAPKGMSLTLDLIEVFLASLSSGDAAVSSSDPYWNDTLRELLTHSIDLLEMATGRVDLQGIFHIVRTAPKSSVDAVSRLERVDRTQSLPSKDDPDYCIQLLRLADQKVEAGSPRRHDLRDTAHYWMNDFPNLSSRTRSVIVSSFTAKVSGLLRDPLRRLTDGDSVEGSAASPIDPEETHRGKIVIVDLPIKELGEVGRLAQVIFKTVWQRSTERRDLTGPWRSVFLWADESQYFVTQYDALFQQTARSKFSATVYLTQNLPNYYSALPGKDNRAVAESLLGNLQTKIFHSNGDPTTNEWASRVFGNSYFGNPSSTISGSGSSLQTGQNIESIVQASGFTVLKRGGSSETPEGPPESEAIIYGGGRVWKASRRTYLQVLFNQNDGTTRVGGGDGRRRQMPG
jgi:hypothetical protein